MPLPDPAPSRSSLTADFAALDVDRQVDLIDGASALDDKGRYLPWDQIRYRTPPQGLTVRQYWFGMSMARRSSAQTLPLLGRGAQTVLVLKHAPAAGCVESARSDPELPCPGR